jgi:hypothetical protein
VAVVAALHGNVDVSPLSECDAITGRKVGEDGKGGPAPADVPAYGRWVPLASQMGGGKGKGAGVLTRRVTTITDLQDTVVRWGRQQVAKLTALGLKLYYKAHEYFVTH